VPVRCLPEEPAFESPAEGLVWRAVRDRLPPGSLLVANQRFTDRSGDCEADIIAAVPGVGIAVVEVKGGLLVHDGQGWVQTTGRYQRRTDPVDQGRRCKYALRGFLDRSPAWPGLCDLRLAHLIAFPYTRVPRDFDAPDCPRWLVIDMDEVEHASERLIAVLDGQATLARRPTTADVAAVAAALTGGFGSQRDLLDAGSGAGSSLVTDGQGVVLDLLRGVRRAQVRGVAGSGKTWLAVEKARRLSREGQRVALVCASAGLAAYLRRRCELLDADERPAYVGAVQGLEGAGPEPFDAVIVDQALDLPDTCWPRLLARLTDPDEGALYVFADEAQRVFARYGDPPVTAMPVPMSQNVRNSGPIAAAVSALVPVDMTIRRGDGVPVRVVACRPEDALAVADREVADLLAAGWASEHVALLTTGPDHPAQRDREEARGTAGYWASYWDGEDVFYGNVLAFRGLERPAVVVAVNGFPPPSRPRELLYAGMSRARDLLVVCGDPDRLRRVVGDGFLGHAAS
jgi:Nuclease-related domain/UvrD-like helicase C-terminal domain